MVKNNCPYSFTLFLTNLPRTFCCLFFYSRRNSHFSVFGKKGQPAANTGVVNERNLASPAPEYRSCIWSYARLAYPVVGKKMVSKKNFYGLISSTRISRRGGRNFGAYWFCSNAIRRRTRMGCNSSNIVYRNKPLSGCDTLFIERATSMVCLDLGIILRKPLFSGYFVGHARAPRRSSYK